FFVEAETLGPAGILVDPRILATCGRRPADGAPDVEQEGPVFGGEAGDTVRADHPARQFVPDLHLVEMRADSEPVRHQPFRAQSVDLGEFGGRPFLDLAELVLVPSAIVRFLGELAARGRSSLGGGYPVLVAVD